MHIYICKLDDYEEEDAWAEEGECSGFSFFLRGKSLSFFGRSRHGDVDHGGPLHGAPHVIFHNNNTETIALYVARRCDWSLINGITNSDPCIITHKKRFTADDTTVTVYLRTG